MDDMGKVDWGFSADEKARKTEQQLRELKLLLVQWMEFLCSEATPEHEAMLRRMIKRLG